MYKVFVPIFNKPMTIEQKEKLAQQLNRFNPDLIFLTYHRILFNQVAKLNENKLFCENKSFFESKGFKVAAWVCPSIGYGQSENIGVDNGAPYNHLITMNGTELKGAFCPLDHDFVNDFNDTLRQIISTGVKTIMFEDDFSLTGGKTHEHDPACCCDEHLKRFCDAVGEKVERNQLYDLVYNHGPNKYRKAWLKLQGDTLRGFAENINKTVHDIDPNVRVGVCANSSTFSIEGVNLDELARIMAGNTKPFIRLTGAPYWRRFPIFAPNIEAARVITQWCGDDIEIITEGDVYPRPRNWVPAALLEIYDMVLRADGNSHGILKYMLEYGADADNETGYVDRHILNKNAYEYIENNFKGDTVGLNVFENTSLFDTVTFSDDIKDLGNCCEGSLPLISQWFTCENSIPVTYKFNNNASLVFGENAKFVTEKMLDNGVILDAHAAKILFEKGIDIGIKGYKRADSPTTEMFLDYNDNTPSTVPQGAVIYDFDLKENVKISSNFTNAPAVLGLIMGNVTINDYETYPACYFYENAKGQRFMVYSFVARTVLVNNDGWLFGMFRKYSRQRQLIDGVKWLQKGRGLPAVSPKNPQLYILCKKNAQELTIGLWNIFPDKILKPEILLDSDNYAVVSFYNCEGKIIDNKLILNDTIEAYDFAFIKVKEKSSEN